MSILAKAKNDRRQSPDGFIFQSLRSGGVDEKRPVEIRYGLQISRDDLQKGTVFFLPGRTEFAEKFFEDMHVWNDFGFQAAAIDLRGQGLSHRPGPSRGRHFIDTFDHHVPDVRAVIEKAESAGAPRPFYIMAHSAGSHVSIRYLHDHPGDVAHAFLIAPMIGIAKGGLPGPLVRGLPRVLVALGLGTAYVPGHKGIKLGEWGWRKQLTHDRDRFEDEDFFINTLSADLAVGGATYRWVHEALASCSLVQAAGYAENIQDPLEIFQAGVDGIVDNPAMTDFAARCPTATPHLIKGAKHEILKETDDKRALVWRTITHTLGLDPSSL